MFKTKPYKSRNWLRINVETYKSTTDTKRNTLTAYKRICPPLKLYLLYVAHTYAVPLNI